MSPCESNGCVDVSEYGERGEHIRVRSAVTGTAMQCTPAEWRGFIVDISEGKWAHVGVQEASTSSEGIRP